MNQETRDFIRALYDGVLDNLELRAFPSKSRQFLRSFKAMKEFCDLHEGENLYFGVATRKTGTTKGRLEDCSYIPGLWVDIDFKTGLTEVEANKLLMEGPLRPSVIVYSGNGVHVYWLLKEPKQVQTSTEEIRARLRRLAEYYQGDLQSAEPARILRLPGTINTKYSPPRPVFLAELNDQRYIWDDFEIYGESEEVPKNEEGWDDELLRGVSEGARDDSATKLAGKWFGLGLSRQEVIDALTGWNQRNEPPLPHDDLVKVVDSIGRRHDTNHPQEAVHLPQLTLADWEQAYHDLRFINKDGLKTGGDDWPGYAKLEGLIGGVWRDGIVISGRPGEGKSILMLNAAVRFARGGHRVMIYDIENDRRDVVKRLVLISLTMAMAKPPTEYGLLQDDNDVPRILPHLATIEPWLSRISLFSAGDGVMTPKVMESWMQLASDEIGRAKKYDEDGNLTSGMDAILIIDSLNELASAHPLAKGEYESLQRWLATIKNLKVKYQLPVCLICHVPKEGASEIFNPKGSSGIAHFARTQLIVRKKESESTATTDQIRVKVVRAQFAAIRKDKNTVRFILCRQTLGVREGRYTEDDEADQP